MTALMGRGRGSGVGLCRSVARLQRCRAGSPSLRWERQTGATSEAQFETFKSEILIR